MSTTNNNNSNNNLTAPSASTSNPPQPLITSPQVRSRSRRESLNDKPIASSFKNDWDTITEAESDKAPLISSNIELEPLIIMPNESEPKQNVTGSNNNGGKDTKLSFEMEELQPSETIDSINNPSSKGKKLRRIKINDRYTKRKYAPNITKNQKYNIYNFLIVVLFDQFKYFYNLYFLFVALSQFIPQFKIGYLFTYIGPLAFVLTITLTKEAWDDYQRYKRDLESNSQVFEVLRPGGLIRSIPSSRIKVGDILIIRKDQRIPADMVLLQTSGDSGSCFIRTEQLDGETDWKLRLSVPSCQTLGARVCEFDGIFNVEEPHKNIYSFFGTISRESNNDETSEIERVDPIGLDNTVWANTVLASNGYIIGAVIYTGKDTRAALNTNNPQTKMGIFDLEVNQMSKILCFVTLIVSFSLISINGFQGTWYIYLVRFLILFSSIIPISLKVNMDMGKVYYSRCISRDSKIANTIVRSSTIPEELGRIEYLLTDKTGTLTQNLMELQKLHLGTIKFDENNMTEVSDALSQLNQVNRKSSGHSRRSSGYTHLQSDQVNKIGDLVEALALCHTVSPIYDQENNLSYQPSSPDEGAIIEWTRKVGLTLVGRDPSSIEIENTNGTRKSYKILQTFPFSSETKRMGIILKSDTTDQITFFIKGADSIMSKLVKENDWLDDACDLYAAEGLRTLVIGKKNLTEDQYSRFEKEFHEASVSLQNRRILMQNVISHHLERNLDLLGLTGVEDKLQDQVTNTLESLRTAGIKIWMLTGDKVETAICIARSSNLCYQGQKIHKIVNLRKIYEAQNELELLQNQAHSTCLVIDGQSLQFYLSNMKIEFIKIATNLACVVCCRCSPTQKAEITQLIKNYTKKRTLAIGDGGNDVSMIQMANVGVGIVGKEGKQASLAADFSVEQFSALTRLLLWHGRNSYKRSAKISLFIIHRGLIISTMQVVFSAIFYFSPIALFQGVLLVGYTTLYTNFPVFALVLDSDITEDIALMYPELYKDLTKGRTLSYRTFFTWFLISVYQGGIIMLFGLLLFDQQFINIISICFTSLILNELITVALEVDRWHWYMLVSQLLSLGFYALSIYLFPNEFDIAFILTHEFWWKVGLITILSCFPLFIIRCFKKGVKTPEYTKLN